MAFRQGSRLLYRQATMRHHAECLFLLDSPLRLAVGPLQTLQLPLERPCSAAFPQTLPVTAAGLQLRLFRAGRVALENVEVEIQSMGESITEGTVAEILKSEGDAVEEDETIAQIETDKVTIDIKSPTAGKVAELRVKVEDTVTVGQIVAIIAGGEAGGEAEKPKPAGKRSKKAAEPSEGQSEQKKAAASQPPPPEEGSSGGQPPAARKPMIQFPKRMTDDGKRISSLSEEERQRQQPSQRGQAQAGSTAKPAAPQPKKEPQPQKSMPWYVGKEQGTKLSQSRVLSQKEIDMIELGGVDP